MPPTPTNTPLPPTATRAARQQYPLPPRRRRHRRQYTAAAYADAGATDGNPDARAANAHQHTAATDGDPDARTANAQPPLPHGDPRPCHKKCVNEAVATRPDAPRVGVAGVGARSQVQQLHGRSAPDRLGDTPGRQSPEAYAEFGNDTAEAAASPRYRGAVRDCSSTGRKVASPSCTPTEHTAAIGDGTSLPNGDGPRAVHVGGWNALEKENQWRPTDTAATDGNPDTRAANAHQHTAAAYADARAANAHQHTAAANADGHRCTYVDGHTHVDADGHTHAYADARAANAHQHTAAAYADGHCCTCGDGHPHTNAHWCTCGDGHRQANAAGHADGHWCTYGDGYQEACASTDRHTNADGHWRTYGDGHTHVNADGHTHASADTRAGGRVRQAARRGHSGCRPVSRGLLNWSGRSETPQTNKPDSQQRQVFEGLAENHGTFTVRNWVEARRASSSDREKGASEAQALTCDFTNCWLDLPNGAHAPKRGRRSRYGRTPGTGRYGRNFF